jgi:hypothetical protein
VASIPLRFSRLEIGSAAGYQTLRARTLAHSRRTLFIERNLQLSATWHFSRKFNLRLTHQQATLRARAPFAGLITATHANNELSSVLISYQTNWQTRLYVGAVTSSASIETPEQKHAEALQVFAKISYAFSN